MLSPAPSLGTISDALLMPQPSRTAPRNCAETERDRPHAHANDQGAPIPVNVSSCTFGIDLRRMKLRSRRDGVGSEHFIHALRNTSPWRWAGRIASGVSSPSRRNYQSLS